MMAYFLFFLSVRTCRVGIYMTDTGVKLLIDLNGFHGDEGLVILDKVP